MKIMVVARFIRLIFSVLLYCIYKIICKVLGHCCARSGDSRLSQEACFDCSISVLKKKKKVETSSDFIIISSFKILIVLWFWHFLSRSYSCSLALVYIFCLFSIVNWFFFHFIYILVSLFFSVSHSFPFVILYLPQFIFLFVSLFLNCFSSSCATRFSAGSEESASELILPEQLTCFFLGNEISFALICGFTNLFSHLFTWTTHLSTAYISWGW